ncbi:MAG: class II fructose-bisphosphate aldolase [Candidatus Shapirobacteria bacterium]|jgi:fructose-bisphosphate aldolase class II
MPDLRSTLTNYQAEGKSLPAFNIDTFEIYQAVEEAVRSTGLPCIVQLSPGEDKFIQAERLMLLAKKARLEGLPIYLNMDHGKDLARLEKLVRLGFDMVHFDGSPLDYSTNQAMSQLFISRIHQINPLALVEAEFNQIQPVSQNSNLLLTDPIQAKEFVSRTGADLLAVSVGNRHGVPTAGSESINLPLLSEIRQCLPTTLLTLHGGSGIDSAQISQAVKSGIVKININTDLRLKFKHSLANALSAYSSEKIYDYFQPVVADLKQLIITKLLFFSSSY